MARSIAVLLAAAWCTVLAGCEPDSSRVVVRFDAGPPPNGVLADKGAPADAAEQHKRAVDANDGPVWRVAADTSGSIYAPPEDTPAPTGPPCKKPSDCFAHPQTPYCMVLYGVCVGCIANHHCPAQTPYCMVLYGVCVGCIANFHCPADGQYCAAGNTCADFSCSPGAKTCIDGFLATCAANGKTLNKTVCDDATPYCVGGVCMKCLPNETFCAQPAPGATNSKLIMKCDATGQNPDVAMQCGGATICLEGKCGICSPGLLKCDGHKAMVCESDSSGWTLKQNCSVKDLYCLGGLCVDPCALDIRGNSPTLTCGWRSAPLAAPPAAGEAKGGTKHAILAVNYLDSGANTLVLTSGGGSTAKFDMLAQSVLSLELPPIASSLPWPVNVGTSAALEGYRLHSDAPARMMRFAGGQVAEGSWLLSDVWLGSTYRVMTRPQRGPEGRAFLTVLGRAGQSNKVSLHVQVKTLASTDGGAAVPAGPWPGAMTFTLQAGEGITIQTDADGADFSGMLIQSVSGVPISVFAGNKTATVPDREACVTAKPGSAGTCATQGWPCKTGADCPAVCCADHLEEQLLPLSSWGTTVPAMHSWPRGKAKDTWQILAAEDGTTVETTPQQVSVATLDAGQWLEFESAQDFVVKASKPVLVGQFIASHFAPGANNDTCTGTFQGKPACAWHLKEKSVAIACKVHTECPNIPQAGDALLGGSAFLQTPSLKNQGKDLPFGVPATYDKSYLSVAIYAANPSLTGKLLLDGKLVATNSFVTIPGTTWHVARMPVTAGLHRLQSPVPTIATLHGFSKARSYGLPILPSLPN